MVMMRKRDNVWESTGWITVHYVNKKKPFQCADIYNKYYFFILHEARWACFKNVVEKNYMEVQRSDYATSNSPLSLIGHNIHENGGNSLKHKTNAISLC